MTNSNDDNERDGLELAIREMEKRVREHTDQLASKMFSTKTSGVMGLMNSETIAKFNKLTPSTSGTNVEYKVSGIPITECPHVPDNAAAIFREDILKQLSRSLGVPLTIWHEYRCPFDFMDEFDQWIEWKKRVYFNKEFEIQ